MKADLHLHTWYSDGTESPSEMVGRAARLGYGAVAIADHDTVAGVPEALEAGHRLGVLVIPGSEITARHAGVELHMLVYFNPACGERSGWRHPEMLAELALYAAHRLERARRIVDRLKSLGVAVGLEDVVRLASRPAPAPPDPTAVGRPHVARAMVAAGGATSIDDAFQRYLRRGASAWVDKERAEAAHVIALVHRVGGLVVMAHPGLARNENLPDELRRLGADGVEAIHSRHPPTVRRRLMRFAREHDLLATGGSDCHGNLKGEPLLGSVELVGEPLELFLKRVRKLPAA